MGTALLNDDLDKSLGKLIEQWNIAERRIKKAEQVRGNEVVTSAIFELRYAGRKLIDIMQIALTENWQNNSDEQIMMHEYLADAIQDCVKAKHDAIDSMLDFIIRWLNEVEKSMGLSGLQKYFPNYIKVTSKIFEIQEKIIESRGNRHLGRDQIYDEIEQDGYDEILALYDVMRTSKDRVKLAIEKERNIRWFLIGMAIISPVLSVIALVVVLN